MCEFSGGRLVWCVWHNNCKSYSYAFARMECLVSSELLGSNLSTWNCRNLFFTVRRSKVYSQHHEAETTVLAIPCSLWRLSGKIHSLPLPIYDGSKHYLACGHITPVSASMATLPSFLPVSNLPLPYKDIWSEVRPTRQSRVTPLISRFLMYSNLQRLFFLWK